MSLNLDRANEENREPASLPLLLGEAIDSGDTRNL